MILYRTKHGPVVETEEGFVSIESGDWCDLLNSPRLLDTLSTAVRTGARTVKPNDVDLLPPVDRQEVWAAGVTYFRSRDARMEEARETGGDDFYARVYDAERPELFLKATGHRVVGIGDRVRIRRDARWNVPEPELTLVINARAEIVGYTIGNDMSSRDIEGENPLYLPQAKYYDGACAIGPGILVTDEPLPKSTTISLNISRDGATVFEDTTDLTRLKREPDELVSYLYRETSFPDGCLLLTGTGIVPPNDFTLRAGDRIRIGIAPIGELINVVDEN